MKTWESETSWKTEKFWQSGESETGVGYQGVLYYGCWKKYIYIYTCTSLMENRQLLYSFHSILYSTKFSWYISLSMVSTCKQWKLTKWFFCTVCVCENNLHQNLDKNNWKFYSQLTLNTGNCSSDINK